MKVELLLLAFAKFCLLNVPRPVVASFWSPWSGCSVTCGKGLRNRIADSFSLDVETEVCLAPACVDGDVSWLSWTPWSACSLTCGTGSQYRKRLCMKTVNAAYGRDLSKLVYHCHGEYQQVEQCIHTMCNGNARSTLVSKGRIKRDLIGRKSLRRRRNSLAGRGLRRARRDGDDCRLICTNGTDCQRLCVNQPAPSGETSTLLVPPIGITSNSTESTNEGEQHKARSSLMENEMEWSSWGPWSPCSNQCGNGEQERLRRYRGQQPSDGQSSQLQLCVGIDSVCMEATMERTESERDTYYQENAAASIFDGVLAGIYLLSFLLLCLLVLLTRNIINSLGASA